MQRLWAEDSYRHGLYPITAGQWLADTMGERVRAAGHGVRPRHRHRALPPRRRSRGAERRGALLRARRRRRGGRVPVALAALAELHAPPAGGRGRGSTATAAARRRLPLQEPRRRAASAELRALYAKATVGLVLSMTNYSLVAQEMLACGLPCVELDAPSVVAAFGRGGPIELRAAEPIAIADALERLLDDPALRADRAEEGVRAARRAHVGRAAAQVDDGLARRDRPRPPRPRGGLAVPALRRRRGGGEEPGVAPAVPWALGELLRVGPAPLVERPVGRWRWPRCGARPRPGAGRGARGGSARRVVAGVEG